MNICVDLRPLHGNDAKRGIGIYIINLIKHILEIDKTNEYILVIEKQVARKVLAFIDNIDLEQLKIAYFSPLRLLESWISDCSEFHEKIYKILQKYPGIIVMHDYSLHAFIYHISWVSNNYSFYMNEFKGCDFN